MDIPDVIKGLAAPGKPKRLSPQGVRVDNLDPNQKYMSEVSKPKDDKKKNERNLYTACGVLIGCGIGYAVTLYTWGTPMADMLIPVLLPAAAGGGAGVMYVISKGHLIKEMFMAKTFPGGYKYGLGMATDGNGVTIVAPLKKHNAKADYFIHPKNKKPIILDRNKAHLGNQLISIDKVPILQYSMSDSVPAYPVEGAAAEQFLWEMARATVEEEFDVCDADGNPTGKKEKRPVPKYPEIYKIPFEKNRQISDMVFEAENREQLLMFALSNVVLEKQYTLPEMVEMQMMVEKIDDKTGQPMIDQNGEVVREPAYDKNKQPIFKKDYLRDEAGKIIYRKATVEETEQIRYMHAEDLVDEVIKVREEAALTPVKPGISVMNTLYSIVVRPWMQGEMDNIRMQSIQQAVDEQKEYERQAKRVDNAFVFMVGAAVAIFIMLVGLKVAGYI